MQLLTGQDGSGDFPLTMEVKAGSSKTEPGVTPQNNITLSYTAWSEVQDACGESRLYGGMHFSKAVPGGRELCTGLASHIVNRAEKLKMGDSSGALADLYDTSITVKKSSNSCVDNESWTFQKPHMKSGKGCKWFSKANTLNRCREVPGAVQNCPVACNACG